MKYRKQKQSIWIIILLISYNFVANLANDIYLPSMPTLVEIFHTTPNITQLTMTAWFAGVAFPQLFLGPWSDRVGRRPVILSGGITFVIATFICTLSPHIWILIIARFFQGMGVCSLNITSFSLISELYSHRERVLLLTYISMCSSLSPLMGPVIGGYILVWFGWRENFLLILILSTIIIVGIWYKLPESVKQFNLNATKFEYMYRNYLHLIRNRHFLRYLVSYCLMLGGLIAYLTGSPFIIINMLKISPERYSYSQIFVFGAYILGSIYLISYGSKRFKIQHLLYVGLMISTLAGLIMVFCSIFWGNSLYSFIIPMILYAIGFSLCSSPLVNKVMSADSRIKGYSAAFLGFGMALGGVMSSLLTGLFYNGTMWSVSIVISLMPLFALLNFIFLRRKIHKFKRN